jgi:hypothetical protein
MFKMEIKYFWKNNHGLEREDRKHDTANTRTKKWECKPETY